MLVRQRTILQPFTTSILGGRLDSFLLLLLGFPQRGYLSFDGFNTDGRFTRWVGYGSLRRRQRRCSHRIIFRRNVGFILAPRCHDGSPKQNLIIRIRGMMA